MPRGRRSRRRALGARLKRGSKATLTQSESTAGAHLEHSWSTARQWAPTRWCRLCSSPTLMKSHTPFAVLRASCAVLAAATFSCGGNGHTSPSSPALSVDASPGPAGDAGAHKPARAGVAHDGANPSTGDFANPTTTRPGADAGAGGLDAGRAGADAQAAAPNTPPTAIRFADWAPDAPAGGYDLCTANPGDLTWTGPLLGFGVTFPRVGRYVTLAPGSYDFRVVAAGSPDCSVSIVDAIGVPAIATNQHLTIALVGAVSPQGAQVPAQIVSFMDDVSPVAGQAQLRFINAAPAATVVDFGTGSLRAGNFMPLASDVLFGQTAVGAGISDGGAPDTNGYLTVAPLMRAVLSAQAVGAMTDLTTASNVTMAAGSVDTITIVNGAGTSATPQMLLCRDNAPAEGTMSSCSVLAP